MPVRDFVVIVLPARDTRLGILAADTGCRLRLLARRAPGPSYDIEFEAQAVAARAAQAAAHDLARLAEFWYSLVDAESQTWRAAARVPVPHIASQTLRLLGHATLDAGVAWLVLDGGFAQLRLLPAPGVPAEAFARQVQGLLDLDSVPWDVYVAALESEWYDRACRSVPAPMLA